jgi:hypothetical protein
MPSDSNVAIAPVVLMTVRRLDRISMDNSCIVDKKPTPKRLTWFDQYQGYTKMTAKSIGINTRCLYSFG